MIGRLKRSLEPDLGLEEVGSLAELVPLPGPVVPRGLAPSFPAPQKTCRVTKNGVSPATRFANGTRGRRGSSRGCRTSSPCRRCCSCRRRRLPAREPAPLPRGANARGRASPALSWSTSYAASRTRASSTPGARGRRSSAPRWAGSRWRARGPPRTARGAAPARTLGVAERRLLLVVPADPAERRRRC